ncbi:MAG: N-acetylglucosamine-6-phosphate deacetylase [Armatimonas sp.]
MNRLLIRSARVVTETEVLEGADVLCDAGRIVEIGKGLSAGESASVINAEGRYLLPGFLDVHIHGGGRHDTMTGTIEALNGLCDTHARYGTTGLLATTITQSNEAVSAALKAAAACTHPILRGIHLEGPYISPEKPGAQPKQFVRDYDEAEFTGWLADAAGRMLRITLAPEQPGAEALIERCRAEGIAISLGHTDASAAQLTAALDICGQADATHLFNAMNGIHHRKPGPVPVFLTDPRCHVEIIADGHHVAPEVIAMAVRAAGVERVIAITDAMEGAGVGDGVYGLGGHRVTVTDGRATLPDGTLAGSVLTMDQAARNLKTWCDLTWPEVARITASNAADRHGWKSKGRITLGCDADLVLVDDNVTVHRTIVAGQPL